MHRLDSEREFHNSRFAGGDGKREPTRYYFGLERWYENYITRILNGKAHHVLEIGSGLESISLQMESCSFDLRSIDISEEAIDFMNRNNRRKNVHFDVQDAHKMSFANSSFDMVVGRGILHHLDLPIACEEIRRVLKPGGQIVFGEPLDCNVLINMYRRLTPQLRTKDERPLSSKDLAVLRKNFGPLDVTYYGFLTLGPALLGLRSPGFVHELDNVILNRLGLGRFLAWACILSN